jgi:hypothetical protein
MMDKVKQRTLKRLIFFSNNFFSLKKATYCIYPSFCWDRVGENGLQPEGRPLWREEGDAAASGGCHLTRRSQGRALGFFVKYFFRLKTPTIPLYRQKLYDFSGDAS